MCDRLIFSGRLPLTIFAIAASFSIATTIANAEGFRILDQSTSATGQGTAFAAQADDASAIHFNPAGMTQLRGVQFAAGTLFVNADTTFRSASGTKVKGDFGGTVANPPPSHMYLTANLGDIGIELLKDWTVGLGVNTPFGISVDYPDDSLVAPVSAEAALPLIDIKPTVAWRFNDYVSFGAGLDIYTFASFIGEGQGEFHQTAAAGNAFGVPAGTSLEANGTDTALGFNTSVLVTPFRNEVGKPLVNLAFVYHSHADLDLEGKFLANGTLIADASTTLELPQIFTWGIAVWPLRDEYREWKLEVDVDYADWTAFKDLNLTLSNGATVPLPRNYKDAFVVMVGTEHKWLQPIVLPEWELALRAGYVYSESPIPSSTFDGTPPDAAYSALSVGLGMLCKKDGLLFGLWQCGGLGMKAIGLDLAYQVLLYQTRGISNNINPTLINGEWDTIIHVGAMTLRIDF